VGALINPAKPESAATNAASHTTPWDTITHPCDDRRPIEGGHVNSDLQA
jgi:hypothetical protein